MIEHQLEAFATVTPELARERALLARCDCKYVVPASLVATLLPALAPSYAVHRVPAGCVATYRSVYFDTPDLACLHAQLRIRIRQYPDRRIGFVELKRRHDDRSDKERLAVAYDACELGAAARAFLRQHVGMLAGTLQATAVIEYRRIGLVGRTSEDRVSIDVDVAVGGASGAARVWPLAELAIVEVKRAAASVDSPAMAVLAAAGARTTRLSKYVTAIEAMAPARGVA